MRKHFHFIGIGGIGMSALARILIRKGEKISGSDIKESEVIRHLEDEGAEIFIGHSKTNVRNPDAIIYSTDIPEDNAELLVAKEERIPILHRSELLAQTLAGFIPLLVTGTHGKTTTACLLAHALEEAGHDPSYALGGYLRGPESNGRFGKGVHFVVEADESDGSFLNYPSFGAIITNLEHDHMCFWKNETALLKAFHKFASQVGSKQHLFWCYDDLLLRSLDLHGYSYGFHEDADLIIDNFQQIGWKMYFDITFKNKHYQGFEIPLIGAHNVLNAAAVVGLGLQLDISEKSLRLALKTFRGVGRRVEKKGSICEIEVYDDYAHHPTEIFATLRALRKAVHSKRIVVAFQPHRYSRTKYCLDDFADAFEYADEVIMTDIYGANEAPLPEVAPEKMIRRIKIGGFKAVEFVKRAELPEYLCRNLKKGDVLITMGAGDITTVGPSVLKLLEGSQ